MKNNRITNSEQFFKPKTIFHTQSNYYIHNKEKYTEQKFKSQNSLQKTQIKLNTIKLIKKDSTPNSAIHP